MVEQNPPPTRTDLPAPAATRPAGQSARREVLSSAFIRSILDAVETGEAEIVQALLAPLHPADIASLFEALDIADRRALINLLGDEIDPEVLSELDEDIRTELVRALGSKTVAEAIKELDVEDAAYVIDDLDDSEKREVLSQVPIEDRAQVVDALLFPEESAGRVMHREFVAMRGEVAVDEALAKLKRIDAPEDFNEIFIVDEDQRPIGIVSLNRLVRADTSAKLSDIGESEIHIVDAVADPKTYTYLFEHYHINSAPVVDDGGKLVGVLSAESVVEILNEMHKAEVLALGGVAEEETLSASLRKTAWLRFSWLFVNLLTAIIASIVIGFFEASLEKVVALAILMPIVASMGGNAGTQTLTVIVRSLATKELNQANLWRIVNREVLIGVANGIGFSALAAAITWIWFKDLALAGVIAAAMIINLLAAALSGVFVPLGLNRMGVDPAVSSPVFVTTVTDVVGFVSFLGLATWLLLH